MCLVSASSSQTAHVIATPLNTSLIGFVLNVALNIVLPRSSINGQVERMNRTIKEATVKRFHYDDHTQLCTHLADFIAAYNFGRRLKTLRGLTPYEFIYKQWTNEPELFKIDPIHQMPGLNT